MHPHREAQHDLEEKDVELDTDELHHQPQATDFAERAFRSPSISTSNDTSSYTSSTETNANQDFISRVQTAQTQQSAGGGGLENNLTALGRIATIRSQHSATVGAGPALRRPKSPLPEFGGGKPLPPPLPEREMYVVDFVGVDDPTHPQNWSVGKKYVLFFFFFFFFFFFLTAN